MQLKLKQRLALPEIRLRFRSTELAVLRDAPDETLLATAAFGNIGSCLVLLSRDGDIVDVVRDANVGWVMKPDGRGCLICGGRDLACFDPESGAFETLARRPVAPEELWGACVTDRYIIVGSDTPKGTLAVYDRDQHRVVKEFSPVHEQGYRVCDIVEAPDGRIVIPSFTPEAVISVLDLDGMTLRHAIPPALTGSGPLSGTRMLDDATVFLMTGTGAVLLSYPDLDPIAQVPNPPDVRFGLKTCAHSGSVVGWGANRPWLLDREALTWDPMVDEAVGDTYPERTEACFNMVSLADGTLVGLTDSSCTFWRLEPGSRTAYRQTVDIAGPTDGAPLAIGDVAGDPTAFGSSHAMERFWSVNLVTGAGRDLGRVTIGGQANGMYWHPEQKRLYTAGYPDRTVRVFDPREPPDFPNNPAVFAQIGAGVNRVSHQLLRIGNSLWTTAQLDRCALGGAIVRIDLETADTETIDSPIPHERPHQMVPAPDDRTLYFGTTIYGAHNARRPVSPAAHLFAFDSRERKLLQSLAPVPAAGTVEALCLLEDGRVLFLDGPLFAKGASLWTWDPERHAVERIGVAPTGLREVLASPDGVLVATAFEGIGPLDLGDPCRIDCERGLALPGNEWDQKMCKHLQWHDGELRCVQYTDVLRFEIVDVEPRRPA